jgi:predicted XRE-type DNA-binding protein
MNTTEVIMTTDKTNLELEDTRVTPSSGNVFADLGFENPEEMLLKAELVRQISKSIKEKELNQDRAAEILGIDQATLSDLVRGRFSGYSLERLFKYLNALGKDLEIVVKPKATEISTMKVTTSC